MKKNCHSWVKKYFSTKVTTFNSNFFLVENFFLPHCGNFFLLIKKKPDMHFYIPQKKFNPKIEKCHCYVHRFAVSAVSLLTNFLEIQGV
jgi:hypothetical protein